jgi:hypothetical protein
MLELRPNCELCDCDLPPEATNARICTYECTFCAGCVDDVLNNVCPNCGGGFVPRPIRPLQARREGLSRLHQPATTVRKSAKFSKAEMVGFAALHKDVGPADR